MRASLVGRGVIDSVLAQGCEESQQSKGGFAAMMQLGFQVARRLALESVNEVVCHGSRSTQSVEPRAPSCC
jgi:hypothetical protein